MIDSEIDRLDKIRKDLVVKQEDRKARIVSIAKLCNWELIKKPIKKFLRKRRCPECGKVLSEPWYMEDPRHTRSFMSPIILIYYTCNCGYEWAGHKGDL
jgi:hypothetical protein